MVRVKSEAYTKAAVKAPRKQTTLRSDSARTPKSGGKSSKYSGGNTYCPRTTPNWQKPITSFFSKNDSEDKSTGENVPEEAVVVSKRASSPDPVPGCSKDSCEPIEEVEESGQVSGEESKSDSCSKEKPDEESHNAGSESDGPEI